MLGTLAGTWVARHFLPDQSSLIAAALTGGVAGGLFLAPMSVLLMRLWDEAHGRAEMAKLFLLRRNANILSALDSFAPHALPSEQVSALAATLQTLEGVDQAYLAVKKLRHSPGDLLVLCLVAQRTGDAALPDKISSAGHLPAGAQIVVLKRGDEALRHALESLPRARIYG